MKITLFTANEPRHTAFVERLADVADEVYVVQECRTVFPGQVDEFFRSSDTMKRYFARVGEAERAVLGPVRFLPRGVRTLPLRRGDLSRLAPEALAEALDSDVFIVFGSSFIRGALLDALVQRRAVNLHMGVSPFFRGSSCNFWALHDGRPDLVGATVHRLTAGLDAGPILFHALPSGSGGDAFLLGMNAVRAAQEAIVDAVKNGTLDDVEPIAQDPRQQLRMSRHEEFTDEVAGALLASPPTAEALDLALSRRALDTLVRPIVR